MINLLPIIKKYPSFDMDGTEIAVFYSQKNKNGFEKILKCIDSCTDGKHIDGCGNMIQSFGVKVKQTEPDLYFYVKTYLFLRQRDKILELLAKYKQEISEE